MALTFTQIKAIKPTEKLKKHTDGGGLSLWVYPTGKMRWALAYREHGKQKTAYLGDYPAYSLADARRWRDTLKERIERGLPAVDVSLSDSTYLFQNVYRQWFERWKPEKKNKKYPIQVERAIDSNVIPHFENRDIRQIKPVDIVQALRGMEERGALEYLRRVKGWISLIFDFAVDSGLVDVNPVKSVGKQAFKRHKGEHFQALPPDDLPILIRALEDGTINGRARLAIYWQLLTHTRPIETVSAKWADIDLQEKQWIIQPEDMKKSRLHIVPLSSFIIELLKEIKSINRYGVYLFEGDEYGAHLNRETPRITLRKKGIETTAHGLRALVATLLEEKGYPEEVITASLSHAKGNGNKSIPAYLRSTFYDERAEMLEELGEIIRHERAEILSEQSQAE